MPASLPDTIKTARLLLRPYTSSDLDDVYSYASDERWSKYLPTPVPYTRQHTADFLVHQVGLDRSVRSTWAIVLDGAVVGGINVRFFPDVKLGELGFSVARRCWGQGIATEAARAVISMAFRQDPELNRIRAMADDRNLASQRVLLKCGMTKEGILRENRVNRGELIDEAWFGITRQDGVPASDEPKHEAR